MLSDVLKFEHFLTPGTIIITDGRTANARFKNRTFKEAGNIFILKTDQHYFYLNEKPLGKWNIEQLKFYKK